MALEATATYIAALVETNPVGATDARTTADDHLRLIKGALTRTFPNLDGEVSASAAALNNMVAYVARTNATATFSSTIAYSNTLLARAPRVAMSGAVYYQPLTVGWHFNNSGVLTTPAISGWSVDVSATTSDYVVLGVSFTLPYYKYSFTPPTGWDGHPSKTPTTGTAALSVCATPDSSMHQAYVKPGNIGDPIVVAVSPRKYASFSSGVTVTASRHNVNL